MKLKRPCLMRLIGALLVFLAAMTAGPSMAAPRFESVRLSDFAGLQDSAVLSADTQSRDIIFTVPQGVVAARVRMVLAAAPVSFEAQPGFTVSLNDGEAVALDPLPQGFSAQFDFAAEDLKPGQNRLTISLTGDLAGAKTGWEMDWAASRLELLFLAPGPADAEAFETWFAADFGAPQTVALRAPDLPEAARADLQARAAIALGRRVTHPLRFKDEGAADFTLSVILDPRLTAAKLIFAGGDPAAADLVAPDMAAARAALDAFIPDKGPRFPRTRTDKTGQIRTKTRRDLSALANGELGREGYSLALPDSQSDRAAALALIARLAREPDGAAAPGWVGFDPLAAPANRDLAVIGPADTLPAPLLAAAPRALEASLRAAEESAEPFYRRVKFGGLASAARPDGGAAARFPSPADPQSWTLVIASARGVALGDALNMLVQAETLAPLQGRVVHWRNGEVQVQDRGSWRPPGVIALIPQSDEWGPTLMFLALIGALLGAGGVARSMRKRKFITMIHGV